MAQRPSFSIDRVSATAWRVMFALAVVLLLVSGGFATWLYISFSNGTQKVEHTYQVLDRIDDLTARVVNAEAGQRGYLITRDPRFLRSYEHVRDESMSIADDLHALVSDNPSQLQLAERLRATVRERLDELARVWLASESGRVDDVALGFERGRELMENIRALSADMRAAENSMLVARGNQVRLAQRGAFLFAALTLALAVVLGAVGLMLDRSIKSRQRAVAEAAEARLAVERINERLFDSSGDCLVLLEPDGRMVSMNRPGLAQMEIENPATIPGQPWPSMWGPSGALASRALTDAQAAGESRFQGPRQSTDGTTRWWDVVISPIRDESGRVVKLLSVARDVTAQKRAEEQLRESEERFRTLADAMPQIVWSTRADGYHDYFNERWYEYTGMPRPGEPGGELDPAGLGQGWNWKDYLHDADVGTTLDNWTRALTSGDPYYMQYRLRRTDGVHRWFIGRALPLRDASGTIVRWFGTCTDIDDEKRAEEERTQLLANERAARSEAERSARLKDEFVSTLSHELRTPLNAIVGWVGVLKQDSSPQNIEKGLAVIERNLRRQSQMIDDLLDVSRIVSGKMRLDVQTVDLAPVIEEAVASALPAADAKGIRLITVLGSAARIQGDPGRLQQVVWNLVANAVKFTPRGGRVQVTLRKEDSQVLIEVSDTGQGITQEFLPQIFHRFRQADASATRQHGGLGLGLAIVKNLVEMHGGSVEASSEGRGRGSVFTVRLPLALMLQPVLADDLGATAESISDISMPKLGKVLSGLRILILDDEADARELVQWFLENAGAETVVAINVDDALTRLNAGLVPDIIVSDIGMPDRDGYDFMQRVRQMPGPASTVPAAALTALARAEDRKRALLAGYQTHLAKPVDPTELIALVASLAGRTGRSVV